MSAAAGRFGRLWGRASESFAPTARRILAVKGKGATSYLQGLVTSDLLSPPVPPRPEKSLGEAKENGATEPSEPQQHPLPNLDDLYKGDQLRSTCFLDHKGRIVTDSLLWKIDEQLYYIDCPGTAADQLLQHLQQHKLRKSKVKIKDMSNRGMSSHVVFGTLNALGAPPGYLSALDPRHPSLGLRILKLPPPKESQDDGSEDNQPETKDFASIMANSPFPDSPGNYELVRRLAGVAEGSEIAGKVALECNQENMQAVSFHKGCYLGQELTARVQHTGVLRKRIMPLLLLDTMTEVPHIWSLASNLQEGRAQKRFTAEELKHKLPSDRLPRLSVLTAGNLVAVTTGSIEPEGEAVDEAAAQELQKVRDKANAMLEDIETSCTTGAKIIDSKDGKTIGQIVSPPVKGTNVVLALMRLDAVGLLKGGTWSKTNKVDIGDGDSKRQLRYLPYLPLWWPSLDHETGKARDEDDDGEEELLNEAREETNKGTRRNLPRIVLEEVSANEEEKKDS